MSKKQAVRLSDKKLQKDRTWLIVAIILAAVLCLLSVMRTFDSDKVAFGSVEESTSTCETKMHPLAAYATGAGIDAAIAAAEDGTTVTCN
ncbi:hypothetical protein ACQHIH_21580 (plasmid) [Xanthomonas sontii]|uniref:Secreted protein n=1 Tax=Xanthomonas sacchari TaxID=56458 RepID=A0ABT3DV43_9XANT|nr:hypothetical protein [Xanthomonas sacchari]MCW0399216.1 hypothetical protein [Xanthomonas sacchari]